MVSGAANSEAALLIIDAKEGVKEQSKRHGYLLHLLGVSQIAVVVNKMDMVGYSQERFDAIEKEYREYLDEIGVKPTYIIPVSARDGDCIVGMSEHMPWYNGPSVIEALDHFKKAPALNDLPLRIPVQDVYKFDERRIIVGRIESGQLSAGDEVIFSPSNKRARVKTIESWGPGDVPKTVSSGMSVGFTLEEQIFVERGDVVSHTEQAPMLSNIFRARIFWLGHKDLTVGDKFKLKINTSEYPVEVKEIEQVIDTDNLAHGKATKVARNAVAEVVLRSNAVITLDPFSDNSITGRFVLVDEYLVVGGGILDMEGFENQRTLTRAKSTNIHQVDSDITAERRGYLNGHKGGVLWFTGLSGSGKTTLAMELQKRLFAKGYQVYVLDGDNVRNGLNRDLGFSPEDRSENIRRIGEVAALFADAGVIVITAFVSPYKKDRDAARVSAPSAFHSIYIKADVDTCEKRDPKGLYKKARSGEILDFTGVQAPYEEPDNPDLVINTMDQDIEGSVEKLVKYVEKQLVDPVRYTHAQSSGFMANEG